MISKFGMSCTLISEAINIEHADTIDDDDVVDDEPPDANTDEIGS